MCVCLAPRLSKGQAGSAQGLLTTPSPSLPKQDNPLYPHLATAKHFLYNTASIFVWSRLLQYIIPLYDGMGSQLMVISQMIREVLKFAVPGIILMTGVCFTLYSMFRWEKKG